LSLVNKRKAFTHDVVPSFRAACILGVLGAFLFAAFAIFLQLGFLYTVLRILPPVHRDILTAHLSAMMRLGTDDYPRAVGLLSPSHKDILAGYLKAIVEWRTGGFSRAIGFLHSLAALAIGSLMAYSTILVLLVSQGAFRVFSGIDVLRLTARVLLSIGAFMLVYSLLNEFVLPDVPSFPALHPKPQPLVFWFLLALLYLFICVPLSDQSVLRTTRQVWEALFVALVQMAMCGGIVCFFFREIPLFGRLCLAFDAVCLCLGSCFALKGYGYHVAGKEGVECRRYLGREVLFPCSFPATGRGPLARLSDTIACQFSVIFLPALFLAVLAYPWLVLADDFYKQNLQRRWNSEDTFVSQPARQVRSDNLPSVVEFIARLPTHVQTGSPPMLPSVMITSIITFLCWSSGVIAAVLSILWGGYWKRQRLGRFLLLLQLGDYLNLSGIREDLRKTLCLQIDGMNHDKHPCARGVMGVPLMTNTCKIVMHATEYGVEPSRYQRPVNWILRCESASGGFGAGPGLQGDLCHTRWALASLHTCGMMDRIDWSKHVSWLQNTCESLMFKHNGLRPASKLENLRFLLECNALLGCKGIVERMSTAETSTQGTLLWRLAGGSVEDTQNLLRVLDLLREPGTAIREHLRSEWLPRHETSLPALAPASFLSDICDCVAIVRSLYPDTYRTRDSIIEVQDSIVKLYSPVGTHPKRGSSE
jgi:hypothetical protein